MGKTKEVKRGERELKREAADGDDKTPEPATLTAEGGRGDADKSLKDKKAQPKKVSSSHFLH